MGIIWELYGSHSGGITDPQRRHSEAKIDENGQKNVEKHNSYL